MGNPKDLKAMLDAAANGPLLRSSGPIPLVQRDSKGVVIGAGYELSSLAQAAEVNTAHKSKTEA